MVVQIFKNQPKLEFDAFANIFTRGSVGWYLKGPTTAVLNFQWFTHLVLLTFSATHLRRLMLRDCYDGTCDQMSGPTACTPRCRWYSTGLRGRHQFIRLSVQSAYLTRAGKLYAEIKIDRSLEHPHRHFQKCFEGSANVHMNLELKEVHLRHNKL